MNRSGSLCLGSRIILVWCLTLTSATFAQTTQPNVVTSNPPDEISAARGPEEARPIRRKNNATTQATGAISTTAAPGSTNGFDVRKVLLSLGAILALIFCLRWAAKRIFPGQVGVRSSRAVQVVSRSVLSPKQQFLLLQVGRRLVVVGDTGGTMSPMCEISDPDEVAELLGQLRSESSESPLSRSFMTLFRRNRDKFEEKDEEPRPLVTSTSDAEPPDEAD